MAAPEQNREDNMLKLTLLPEEYLTINDSVVIQLKRVAGGRADLAIDAPREFPILCFLSIKCL
mgnify:CR=1 FL=1